MGGRNDGEEDDQACGDEMKLESSCENMMCQGRVVLEGVNEAGGGQFTTNSVVESFGVEQYSDKENFTLIQSVKRTRILSIRVGDMVDAQFMSKLMAKLTQKVMDDDFNLKFQWFDGIFNG